MNQHKVDDRSGGLLVDFRPLPFLRNPHVQTLLGHAWPGLPSKIPTRTREIELDDGDRMLLFDSLPATWLEGDPIAVLVHGLSGSHRSGHIRRMARRLWVRGIRVFRLDLRGCGLGLPLARRGYHGGCSDDLRAVLLTIHRESPTSPLSAIGFSLGGNIVLKLAGEAAREAVPGLEHVAAVAPPVDLALSVSLLATRPNRLYERTFLKSVIDDDRRRQRYFPDNPRVQFPKRLSIRDFDALVTAPRWGFPDVETYYRTQSSLPLLAHLGVPALILAARDDPFIPVASLEALPRHDHLRIEIVPHGGHLGFLGWDRTGDIRWAEKRLDEWMGRRED